MGKSEWDKHLRDLLGEFKSEGQTPHWEEFAQQLASSKSQPKDSNPLNDETLKETLSNYKPSTPIEGWERIEASLDAANREFDENVRKKINQYNPPADPLSWQVFLKHWSDSKLLRAKLIVLKVIEFAAVLLLVLTVVNMGRFGKLPFETPLYEQSKPGITPEQLPIDKASNQTHYSNTADLAINETSFPEELVSSSPGRLKKRNSIANASEISTFQGKDDLHNPVFDNAEDSPGDKTAYPPFFNSESEPGDSRIKYDLVHIREIPALPIAGSVDLINEKEEIQRNRIAFADLNQSYITEAIASLNSDVDYTELNLIPEPTYVKALKATFVEFGILTQVDYNQMRMPEDRLYSAGKQIIFPEEGISSPGYGAGFTVAIGHPLWAIETGMIYSSKNFKPDRGVIVGGAFDNGSVEFEAMHLQMVTLPFQYRYRFVHKSRLKAYALGGFGLHVIAQSDIDVTTEYNFPSLSFGENPKNDPALAQIFRDADRISEHIRDGAPFSTKSYFSVNAGLGLEYGLPQNKTLFLQTAYQYQIPNLKFSNNNGKHIRSLSLQAGVRTPIGS